MYNDYFGFKKNPFSIAPDPRFLFMSEQHREALAHLIYGFNSNGGFVLLTGEVGTGKTTVCRCLLDNLPENSAIAFIINPRLTVEELLASICDEFDIDYPDGNNSIKVFVDRINDFLLDIHARGFKAVLIIDEAQNLSPDVLEQLRLLTNLETKEKKLLHIILLGQPELREMLSQPELKQLSQRVVARFHLMPLSRSDIREYVRHRLGIAGVQKQLFSESAINEIFRISGGIPRIINLVCDRALLGAFVREKPVVNRRILKKAASEVFGTGSRTFRNSHKTSIAWTTLLLITIIVGVVLAMTYYRNRSEDSQIIKPDEKIINFSEVANEVNASGFESLEVLLQDESRNDRVRSFQSLFNLWNINYDPVDSTTPCQYAESVGLRCLDLRGNLRSLLLYDRPAVLKLLNSQGSSRYVTLTGISDHSARLQSGDREIDVTLESLESNWLGEYTILWNPPDGFIRHVSVGYEGPLVDWLGSQLAMIDGVSYKPEETSVYTKRLADAIKTFQSSQGLIADGIAGEQTIIKLNSLNNKNIPRLRIIRSGG